MGAPLGLGALGKGASNLLECPLQRYSSVALTEWQLPVGFDAVAAVRGVAAECYVFVGWTRFVSHADDDLVRAGCVRDLDRLGNNGTSEAADFGRGRVPWWVIDARRNHSGVCVRWRPVVLGLHRFFSCHCQGCCQP